MSSIITPNMSLIVPVVGQELGPQYATDINTSLSLIDSHNHTPGLGVPVPTAGLSINADLPLGNNRSLLAKSYTMTPQASPLTGITPDIGALYVSGVDLYYNDINGNQIRITQSGGVAGSSGSITGLTPPATASYSSVGSEFIWQSNVNTAAGMDNGPITIRQEIANANGITIQSPNSLASNYSLVLPGALPASQATVEVDTSGNLSFVPNTTPGGPIISSSSGAFSNGANTKVLITNFTVTITTVGRPVIVGFTFDGNQIGGQYGLVGVQGSGNSAAFFYIYRGDDSSGTLVHYSTVTADTPSYIPPSSIMGIDIVGPGTYTYNAYAQGDSSTAVVSYSSLYAYEMSG
jgi:hypothetical protein